MCTAVSLLESLVGMVECQSFAFFSTACCCRHAGQSLASTIVHWNAADPLDYKQIISIGDESTYLEGTPSWGQPPTVQDLCYVGALCLLLSCRSQRPRKRAGLVHSIPSNALRLLEFQRGLSRLVHSNHSEPSSDTSRSNNRKKQSVTISIALHLFCTRYSEAASIGQCAMDQEV